MPIYAGCVYSEPPPRYAPQDLEDLSAYALKNMKLTGLPIRDSHNENKEVGRVIDEWQGKDGSKYVSFDIPEESNTFVQRIGLENGFYSDLSLSHQVGNPPLPLEVSICHRGRRKNTTVNRSLSVEDYKRSTISNKNELESAQILPEPPVIMASNEATPATTSAPVPSEPVVNPTEAKSETPAPETQSQEVLPASVAAQSPDKYMEVFEQIVSGLSKDQKDIFVKHQLDNMKEMQRLNSENEDLKRASEKMKTMHKENIETTMNTIRNFFLQGADEKNTPDISKIETVFRNHPEAHHQLAPVISCMANRSMRAESNLKVQQAERERSAEERELFQRMRGVQRDSAKPTYDYHSFENAKRPLVSENANTYQDPPQKKQKTVDYASQALDDLRKAMNRSLPSRPQNIRMNERGLM